jgi:PBP1b-binding outer membrane lipoprotein LpoB
MRLRTAGALLTTILVLTAVGCATKTVTRVAPEEQIDLSGRWNDTDSQQVASALVAQSMQTPWVENHMEGGGERPTVIVGEIRNKTPEHIPMKTLVADLERSFINSGRVRVVASAEEREGVRAERQDQSSSPPRRR